MQKIDWIWIIIEILMGIITLLLCILLIILIPFFELILSSRHQEIVEKDIIAILIIAAVSVEYLKKLINIYIECWRQRSRFTDKERTMIVNKLIEAKTSIIDFFCITVSLLLIGASFMLIFCLFISGAPVAFLSWNKRNVKQGDLQ